MRKITLVNKGRGLYWKFVIRLAAINFSGNYIPWKQVYEKACPIYSLRKQEVRETIFMFRDLGLITISPRGVKLNYRVKEDAK